MLIIIQFLSFVLIVCLLSSSLALLDPHCCPCHLLVDHCKFYVVLSSTPITNNTTNLPCMSQTCHSSRSCQCEKDWLPKSLVPSPLLSNWCCHPCPYLFLKIIVIPVSLHIYLGATYLEFLFEKPIVPMLLIPIH